MIELEDEENMINNKMLISGSKDGLLKVKIIKFLRKF